MTGTRYVEKLIQAQVVGVLFAHPVHTHEKQGRRDRGVATAAAALVTFSNLQCAPLLPM